MNALKSFAAVVEKKSFSMAATHLNLSVAQVSKHISWLEAQLKTQLLLRSTRRIVATNTGQEFFHHCHRILSEWDNAKNNLGSFQEIPQGSLKISVPLHSFGICHIANNIPAFLKRYPKLQVELLFQSPYEPGIDQSTDITIFIGTLKGKESFHAIQVGKLTKGVFATPTYLQQNGCPQVTEDLLHHNCIVFLKRKASNTWVFKHNKKIIVSGNYRTNSVYALRDAAKANMGLVWMSHLWAAKDLSEGNLIEILTDYVAPGEPIYLIYKHQASLSLPIKCFINYLKEIL